MPQFTIELSDEEIKNLKHIANRSTWMDSEDILTDHFTECLAEDAYEHGVRDGETEAAGQFLNRLGIIWIA